MFGLRYSVTVLRCRGIRVQVARIELKSDMSTKPADVQELSVENFFIFKTKNPGEHPGFFLLGLVTGI